MKSMRNNFSGGQPYSECFLRMGEKYATVTRLELSPEKFLAFQTEGSIWAELEKKRKGWVWKMPSVNIWRNIRREK